MLNRGRRTRINENIRNIVAETNINKDTLIYPLFVENIKNEKREISSMPDQYVYSPETILFEIENLLKLGIKNIILFGIPGKKDSVGTQAYCENGIIQKTLKSIKSRFKEILCITDVCMCEYTNHGHCGILDNTNNVNNDKTIQILSEIALSHATYGADIIAPSDMMDMRVAKIRSTLDNNGFINTPIMSYSAKYCSAFYGPFREAANSAPSFGDRKSYQMDYRNKNEAIKEAIFDVSEGADIIMVKPALSYLDIIQNVRNSINLPICAYSVSGEYSMIKMAGKNGIINEKDIILETTTSIYRAGANMLITYFAKDIAKMI